MRFFVYFSYSLVSHLRHLRRNEYVKILYALSSTLTLALGLLHMATTFTLASTPSAKVWFFGAGIAIALGGVLNLLNRRYGLAAFGLRDAVAIGLGLWSVLVTRVQLTGMTNWYTA